MTATFVSEAQDLINTVGYDGLWALFNGEQTSSNMDRTLTVRRVSMFPLHPVSNVVGTPGRQTLTRISAASTGTAVSGIAFDSTSPALPSQVELLKQPSSVTTGSALRSVSDTRTYGDVLAMPSYQSQFPSWGVEAGNLCNDLSGIYYRGRDSAVEPIILREGQGIAIIQETVGIPMASEYNVTVRNNSSGDCYHYNINQVSSRRVNEAVWSLMNNTGSGVVLQVSIITQIETGTTNVIPEWRLLRLDGIQEGVEITPVAMDSTNTLPSGVKAYRGPFKALPAGYNEGSGYDLHVIATAANNGLTVAAQQRFGGVRTKTWTPVTIVTTAPIQRFEGEVILWDTKYGDRGIVLRPGQGLGIVSGRAGIINNSCLMPMAVSVEFTHEAPTGGGGGPVEHAYTFAGAA